MGLTSILVLAIGLAMDSFAVSIAGGVGLKRFSVSIALRTGLIMGLVQALFFVAGYFLASSVHHLIHAWDHWIAFALLASIGVKMILDHRKEDEGQFVDLQHMGILLTLAIATSIDALAVGISFSVLHYDIVSTAFIIGMMSFLFAAGGVFLGAFWANVRSFPTNLIGGILLIAIGVRILIEHLVHEI